MAVRPHRFEYLRHRAGGVDDEGAPGDSHRLLAVHVLLPPGAVFLGDLVIDVGQERERQFVFQAEGLVAFGGVGADAQDHGLVLGQRGLGVAKATGLLRAPWRVVLGVEIEDHRRALQARQLELRAVVRRQREIGRLRTYLDPVSHGYKLRERVGERTCLGRF